MSTELTKSFLKKESQEFDLETVFILKLNGRSINDLGCIGQCTNLVHLDLSHNNLRSVMALRTLTQLQNLDLSVNKLTALSGLEHLELLGRLNVSGNQLNSLDCLLPLTKVRSLRSLTLKDVSFSNPLLKNSDNESQVRSNVIQMLGHLHILDGELLVDEGEELSKLCGDFEVLAHQYSNVDKLTSVMDYSTAYTPEPCYLQIGIEKNKIYDAACAVAAECEVLSDAIHKELERK